MTVTQTDSKFRFGELGIVLFVFFLSGASGLIYEVVWTRMLTLVFGGTVFAVSAVLTSFMLGLGIGSLLGGRYADRVRQRRSLLVAYGVLEIAIAAIAVATPILFSILDHAHVAIVSNWNPSRPQVVLLRFCLSLLGILLPTCLMGATLPILSRYLVTRGDHLGLRIGILYSVNTAGAVAGCMLAGFVLIASYGVAATLSIAAVGNLAAGLLAVLAAYRTRPSESNETSRPPKEVKRSPAPADGPVFPGRSILLITVAALSGFLSLAYQVLWTRDFAMSFTSTVYSFTVVVSTFLIGLVLGGLMASAIADRSTNTLTVLSVLQLMVGVTAILLIDFERRQWLGDVILSITGFKAGESGLIVESWAYFMMIRFMIAFLTMLVPATLIGGTFPLLVRSYTHQRDRLGCRVGNLYFANTMGCVFGSTVAGFVLIPLIGVSYSIVTLGLLSVGIGITLAILDPISNPWRRLALVGFAVVSSTVVIGRFDPGKTLTVFPGSQILLTRHTTDGLIQIEELNDRPPSRALVINYGRRLGGSEAVALRLQRRQAHLPMLLHPKPKDVLVIGFATGCTAGTVTLYDSVTSIDGVEIVAYLEETASYFDDANYHVTDDPRFKFHAEDGRNFVRTTSKKYDVIIVDLFQAHDAGVGSLYTIEHYQNCRQRLQPGGLVCQWIPADQLPKEQFQTLIASFQQVFPHSTLWMADVPVLKGIVGIIGSAGPLRIDYEQLSLRCADKSLATEMAKVFLGNESSVLSNYLLGSSELQKLAAGAVLNTDDRPRIEYLTPRHVVDQKRFAAENLSAIAGHLVNAAHVSDYVVHLCPDDMPNCESAVRLKARVKAQSLMIDGLVMQIQGQPDKAIDCFRRARAACPDSREVQVLTKKHLEQLNTSRR